jgi:hypothetical protein
MKPGIMDLSKWVEKTAQAVRRICSRKQAPCVGFSLIFFDPMAEAEERWNYVIELESAGIMSSNWPSIPTIPQPRKSEISYRMPLSLSAKVSVESWTIRPDVARLRITPGKYDGIKASSQ